MKEIRIYWGFDYEIVNDEKRFEEIKNQIEKENWRLESMVEFGYTEECFMVCF